MTVLSSQMGLISINIKDMFFELIILVRELDKRRGPVEAPPSFLSCHWMLFFGWKKKVDGFLRGRFRCETNDKIDDQAAKDQNPLHRPHAQ